MPNRSSPVSVIIVGAGSRGANYATFAQLHPDRMRVVGVAEPRADYRRRLAQTYQVPEENVATDWRVLAERPRLADAVIIATLDAQHAEAAVAFAQQGYAMLLEKPMAPSAADCRRIVSSVKAHGILFAVCHVLRYTPYTRRLKQLLESGAIGDVMSLQHLEPVGYWHQAHSYVRGNWRSEQATSSMLLSKSCHDLDWMRYIMGVPCQAVSSFGALRHFRQSEKPLQAGAAQRCLDCGFEPQCPYSAKRIYLGRYARGERDWPLTVLTAEPTLDALSGALRTGPYGRCVYECDNDVVDNQVVNLLFAGQQTATFTMTAFTQAAPRKTRIFGTRGELEGDGVSLRHFDFLTEQTRTITVDETGDSGLQGHGGGDYGLMDSFIAAVAENDSRRILSGPDESLETHLMVFAAEKARREQAVVRVEL